MLRIPARQAGTTVGSSCLDFHRQVNATHGRSVTEGRICYLRRRHKVAAELRIPAGTPELRDYVYGCDIVDRKWSVLFDTCFPAAYNHQHPAETQP